MAHINSNYLNIKESYLFSDIAKRTAAFKEANPDADIIRLGIGDVTRPLCPGVIDALHEGVDEMSKPETFKGYGPEQGYDFIKNSLRDYYLERGVELDKNNIVI